MRILWHGTPSEFHTGYGNLTRIFTSKLKKLGFDVFIASNIGSFPSYTNKDGIFTLSKPPFMNEFGDAWIKDHFNYVKADFCFTTSDTHVLKPERFKGIPWVTWVVMDSEPPNPLVFDPIIKGNAIPVASNRWAEKVMKRHGFNPFYIPYAFDPLDYFPTEDHAQAKKDFFRFTGRCIEDKFFVVTNGANIKSYSRKNYERMFEIWAKFVVKYPDSVLYVHSCVNSHFGGLELGRLANFFKIPQENLIFAPQYHYQTGLITEADLRLIYNAADCYLQTSKGEGFGLPILEAQACGTPVIVTDCSAMSELCFTGIKVRGRPELTVAESFWVDIDVSQAILALSAMYETTKESSVRKETAKRALDYSADVVIEKYMLPVFEKIKVKLGEIK